MKMRNDLKIRIVTHGTLLFASIACLIPFILMFQISVTEEVSLITNGYSFFPQKYSLEAYRYMAREASLILNATAISFGTTIVGSLASLAVTSLMAYPLSRRDFDYRKIFMLLVFFSLLFNGGLVPTYLVYTKIVPIKNTLLAIMVPRLLMNGFFVMIMRTFFMHSIPEAVVESARMDGASVFTIFLRIVVPMSQTIFVSIGILCAVNYWNEWYNGVIFLTDPRLFSLQNLLTRIIRDIQFILKADITGAETLPQTSVRMAIAVIGTLPIIIAYPFIQKYFIKGITVGAVKG